MSAEVKYRISSDVYDRRLPRCQVCDSRVDMHTNGVAEPHKRLVQVFGKRVAQAEACPGSGLPVKGRRP